MSDLSMPNLPCVSFLVPCFNYAAYLTDCIQSITRQSFQDFEILILDDASTDNTPQVVEALQQTENRIRYFRHESNIGHLLNYNFGIKEACGELIWLISADDALASESILADFVEQFQKNKKLGFAFCRVQCMDENSQPFDKFIPNPKLLHLPEKPTLYSAGGLFGKLVQANFVPAPATIARKACYEQYGFFDLALTHSGDWLNWLLFCLDWDVWFDPSARVYYRKHQKNMHLTYEKPRHALENTLLCYQTLEKFLQEHRYPNSFLRQMRLAHLQFMHQNGFPLSFSQELRRWAFAALHL